MSRPRAIDLARKDHQQAVCEFNRIAELRKQGAATKEEYDDAMRAAFVACRALEIVQKGDARK